MSGEQQVPLNQPADGSSDQPTEQMKDSASLNETVTDTTTDPAEDEVFTLKSKVTELEKQLFEAQARANADMYNLQKRLERETDNARKYALEKFAKSMLDVVDNLERALTTKTDDDSSAFIQGIELTHKAMLVELEKHGVAQVNPVGMPFDANVHQAVGIDPTVAKDTVANVLQKGYTLNGRVLRPAMVTVGG